MFLLPAIVLVMYCMYILIVPVIYCMYILSFWSKKSYCFFFDNSTISKFIKNVFKNWTVEKRCNIINIQKKLLGLFCLFLGCTFLYCTVLSSEVAEVVSNVLIRYVVHMYNQPVFLNKCDVKLIADKKILDKILYHSYFIHFFFYNSTFIV